ncbi:MAG: carbohydrate kinase family protein [Thermoplasmata archaeon]
MKFLAYLGHINIDVIMNVGHIPEEGSVNVDKYIERYGGTAGNFAIVSSKLKFPFDIYSSVSLSTHSAYLEFLKKSGTEVDHISVSNDDYGPICYIASDGTKQVAFVYQGPMIRWNPEIKDDYMYIHLSTGPKYTEIVRKKKGNFIFDPSQEIYKFSADELIYFYENAYISMFNEKEFSIFLKKTRITRPEKMVIVTRGSDGVTLFEDGKAHNFAAIESTGDTVGAGDAFRSGFYYGLYRGNDAIRSIFFGIVAAHHLIEDGNISIKIDPETIESEVSDYEKKNGF